MTVPLDVKKFKYDTLTLGSVAGVLSAVAPMSGGTLRALEAFGAVARGVEATLAAKRVQDIFATDSSYEDLYTVAKPIDTQQLLLRGKLAVFTNLLCVVVIKKLAEKGEIPVPVYHIALGMLHNQVSLFQFLERKIPVDEDD